MAAEWEELSLRDAGISLIDCDHRTPPASETGYPYVTIPQLRHGRIELADARRITREHYIDWTRKAKPRPNDVVLSRRCNPGETAFVSPGMEFALGQNLVLLRADGTRVYPPFLRWLVRGPEWWRQVEKYINVGAVFDSLKCKDIPNFRLRIPPVLIQRSIADVLGALDDKIELNRKMSATLEAMARAIFKSWFVDFDPVRAKAEGRRPEGMDEATAGLFPDRFGEDGLPEGWRQEPLDKLAIFLNGLALQKYPPTGVNDLPVIKIAQLRAGSAGGADLSSGDVPPDYIVRDGDLLFSWSGSLMHRIWVGGNGALNQHLFKVTPVNRPKWLCYLWIDHHLPSFQAIAASKATTMGHIQRHHLREAICILPPDNLLNQADKIVDPLFQRSIACSLESSILASLRDTLLPALVSGRLRVSDTESVVKAAS